MQHKFTPYTGGAGPTKEHSEENIRALAEAVDGEVVYRKDKTGCTQDPEYWATKNDRSVVYDRWGFCSDDEITENTLDQASFVEAEKYLNKEHK